MGKFLIKLTSHFETSCFKWVPGNRPSALSEEQGPLENARALRTRKFFFTKWKVEARILLYALVPQK